MNKRNIINIALGIVIIILFIINIFLGNSLRKDDRNQTKEIDYVNYDSRELNNEKIVDNFIFRDSLVYYIENEGTTFVSRITNNSDNTTYFRGVTAKVYNKNKTLVATLYNEGFINIDPNQEVEVVFKTQRNIMNDIDYVEYIPNYVTVEK